MTFIFLLKNKAPPPPSLSLSLNLNYNPYKIKFSSSSSLSLSLALSRSLPSPSLPPSLSPLSFCLHFSRTWIGLDAVAVAGYRCMSTAVKGCFIRVLYSVDSRHCRGREEWQRGGRWEGDRWGVGVGGDDDKWQRGQGERERERDTHTGQWWQW